MYIFVFMHIVLFRRGDVCLAPRGGGGAPEGADPRCGDGAEAGRVAQRVCLGMV